MVDGSNESFSISTDEELDPNLQKRSPMQKSLQKVYVHHVVMMRRRKAANSCQVNKVIYMENSKCSSKQSDFNGLFFSIFPYVITRHVSASSFPEKSLMSNSRIDSTDCSQFLSGAPKTKVE